MIILWIVILTVIYLAAVLLLSRVMAANSITQGPKPLSPFKPVRLNRRKGPDRRSGYWAPIAAERRKGLDRRQAHLRLLNSQRGAVAVVVAILMGTVLLPFMALTLDFGMLAVDKAKAQNVADSSALAGANALYNDEARPEFSEPGPAQQAGNDMVTANGLASNQCTVELGHYSLATRTFTPGALGNVPADWAAVTVAELDADLFFSNACQTTCTVVPSGLISGLTVQPTAVAIAVKRMTEAADGGAELVRGSGLVL